MSNSSQIESVFFAALEKPSLAERTAFLDEACRGDDELCRRVERMLAAQAQVGSFLESPAVRIESDATIIQPIAERPGTVIGPYKLLQQIGEGGMGVVFMAEQTEPVQRTVALKIIKPGMDTRQVIARFEAERQAAGDDGPSEHRQVLDAGTTDSGPAVLRDGAGQGRADHRVLRRATPDAPRSGWSCSSRSARRCSTPIRRASSTATSSRRTCWWPSTTASAVPKVIDFGVAKATAQRLTERTMFTEFGQVRRHAGVHEPRAGRAQPARRRHAQRHLFAGRAALRAADRQHAVRAASGCKTAAFDEMLRIIREEEPPKPSTRLSSSDTLPSIAANRHTEPARLSKDVRGELDWIVMKALEKDRNRRYETASGFAADVAALSARRAGAGLSAVGGLSLPQVCAAEQDCIGDR